MTPPELRSLFDSSTEKHFTDPLPSGVRVRACSSTEEWNETFARARREAFGRGDGVDMSRVYSPEENERLTQLNALVGSTALEHRLVFVDGDQIVGCYWGLQESWGRYYMIATMIHPSHQGRGVYSAFLARLIAVIRETGFREIYSRHHPDNSKILVPKLKAGFLIASFEITPNFGLLVHLRYPLVDKLRDVYAYRIEATQATAKLETDGIVKRS